MSGGAASFTTWGGDSYGNDVFRGAVDAIARNAAKLKGSHIIRYTNHQQATGDCKLNRLLQIEPNPYMTAYDCLYRLVTNLYINNNAFALLARDNRGQLAGVYPLTPQHVDFLTDEAGTLYCRFLFQNGSEITLPYSDVIHIRRFYSKNDLLGEGNDALFPALELAHIQNEGIVNGIKSSAPLRGILRFTQIMAPEKLKEQRDKFIADYLQISNSGGVVAVDQQMEYTPITSSPVAIDEKQIAAAKTKIFDYLGISEKIVTSSYDENEWAAFYESTIEPMALQLSLEFTRKLFNDRERAFGNQIVFEAGRLQFSSNKTKVELIAQVMPLGLLTVNQALEILNLPGVEGGDKRLQTLNVVNAAKADKYQLQEGKQSEGN